MAEDNAPKRDDDTVQAGTQIDGDVQGDVDVAGRDIITVGAQGLIVQGGTVNITYATPPPEGTKPRKREKTSVPAAPVSPDKLTSTLTDRAWNNLLRRIKSGKCTPFLGPGVVSDQLPADQEIAKAWAAEHNYPNADTGNLPRVAQYLATQYDQAFPREQLLDKWFDKLKSPDFSRADNLHAVLADLPLPIYITATYDGFMAEALKSRNKAARRAYPLWNRALQQIAAAEGNDALGGADPEVTAPLVFHLFGSDEEPESLVLTQDDYLDYLVNVSNNRSILPTRIQGALSGTSLLFLGFDLSDPRFQVLYRGLVVSTDASLRRISVTVQLPPNGGNAATDLRQDYVIDYFSSHDIRVYWGTTRDFARELRSRWEAYKDE